MIKDVRNLKEYYDKKNVVQSYEKIRLNTIFKNANHAAELRIINNYLKNEGNIHLLEIGIGSGRVTRNLEFTGRGTGVDSSPNMLAHTSSIVRDKNWKFLWMNIMNLDFKESTFDAVITIRVIRHFNDADIRKALLQVKKVIKKGGLFIFDIPNSKYDSKIVANILKALGKEKDNIYESRIPIEKLKKTLTGLGFSIIDIKPMKYDYLRIASYPLDFAGIKKVPSYFLKKELNSYEMTKAADLLIIARLERK